MSCIGMLSTQPRDPDFTLFSASITSKSSTQRNEKESVEQSLIKDYSENLHHHSK